MAEAVAPRQAVQDTQKLTEDGWMRTTPLFFSPMAVNHVPERSRDRSSHPGGVHAPLLDPLPVANFEAVHEIHRQHLSQTFQPAEKLW